MRESPLVTLSRPVVVIELLLLMTAAVLESAVKNLFNVSAFPVKPGTLKMFTGLP